MPVFDCVSQMPIDDGVLDVFNSRTRNENTEASVMWMYVIVCLPTAFPFTRLSFSL